MGFGTDIFASIRAAAIIVKWCGHQKIPHTTRMRHVHKVMMLFFPFFQQVDQKVCFLNSQNQYLYSCLTEEWNPKVSMAKAPALVSFPGNFSPRQTPETETKRTQSHTPLWTQPDHPDLVCQAWFLICQIFWSFPNLKFTHKGQKDVLAGRIFKRIRWKQFQERGVVKPFCIWLTATEFK